MLVGNGRTVDPKQQHVAIVTAGLREETLQHVYSGHALQQQLTIQNTRRQYPKDIDNGPQV